MVQLLATATVQAAPFDEQEYFDSNNTVNDWNNWQTTDANGTPNGSPGTNGWLLTRNTNTAVNGTTLTPSAGTGPTSVHSGGAGGGFLFLENSGTPPYPDRYLTRRLTFDASSHELNISFAYAMYGANMGTVQLQANDGSGWVTEWQQAGDDGGNGAWTTVALNLYNGQGLSGKNYTSGSVRLRFRFISGGGWAGDAAIDTIRVFGNESCVETASVSLDPIASPISAPVAVSATLGGTGGSSPQVSFNGSTWLGSGATYTPPAASSGTNNFYARATGSCGFIISDPFNPTPVSYDTTCSDPSPSTINIPVGQVVGGAAIDLTSLFSANGNVGSFSYKINGAAVGSPWNSSSYGTSAQQVISFEVSGTDPDCGVNTLVRSGFITIDNTCLSGAPGFGFDRQQKYSAADSSVDYTITVYNNDAGACADETFTIAATGDSHANFSGTITGPTSLTIAPGGSATTTLNVAVTAGTADWTSNDSTVQVTAAGHNDPADQTATTIAYRLVPLMHNSVTTDSDKHGGKWGTSQAGAKYGEFTCATCHQMGSPNIKGIRAALGNAPNPVPDDFPGAGATINFTDVRDGTSSFGNDGRVDKTSSDLICSVCHSYDATRAAGVDKHAFSVPLDAGHFNRQDCTACHRHSEGFRASCTGCHGDEDSGNYWSDSLPLNVYPDRLGSHTVHVEKIGNQIASGDKEISAFTTMEHKNNSCAYCHPKPGGLNPDGLDHTTNTIGSAADTVDVAGDGLNSDYFLGMDGSNDVDGSYNPTLQRCSNIDCHSNGQFTWSWYGDSLPPAAITDLGAATGSDIGTVDLNWTAPGNDGNTAGKAYRYQIRYSTTAISNDAAWNSATVAGAPPTSKWPGAPQTMTVYGLTPGTLYYFAIKAADEEDNWSPLSSPNPSATAGLDQSAPVFRGLESAVASFESGAVNLSWPAASDRSEPISYNVWWSNGPLKNHLASLPTAAQTDYDPDTTPASGDEYSIWMVNTIGLSHQVFGLQNGVTYQFHVRAKDSAITPNLDSNTVIREAIPQTPPPVDNLGKLLYLGTTNPSETLSPASTSTNASACDADYIWGGSMWYSTMNTSGYDCVSPDDARNRIRSFTYQGDFFTWVHNDQTYARNTLVNGRYLRIYLRDRTELGNQNMTFKLGYWDASGFHLGGSATFTMIPDYRGYAQVDLSGIEFTAPAGSKLALVMRKDSSTANQIEVRFGTKTYKTVLAVNEQAENLRPNAFSVATPTPSVPTGSIDLSWTNAVDPEGDPVTYNVYGVLSSGKTFVIAENMAGNDVAWDTLADGIGLSGPETGVVIKVKATDGLNHEEGGIWYDSREATSGTFTIDNSSDIVAPTAVSDLSAEHRPKRGSVYLSWTAPGDDGMSGRASSYDIRYSTALIDTGNFTAATQIADEPVPGEAGHHQGYEVLGLNPDQTYYFAMKSADEVPNWSGLSNVPSEKGGPTCGVCHSTPPDQAGRGGMHEQHGFTQIDCAKCHGSEAINFHNDHSDGVNKLAFNNPKKGFTNTAYGPVVETATQVTYHNDGTAGSVAIYDDTDGGGGFNDIEPGGNNSDDGSCFSFNASGVTGCHGAAGSDPDGAGPLPTFPAPKWNDINSVSCAMCHGDPFRENVDPYGRPYEDGTHDDRYANNAEIFKSAPAIDLLGRSDSNAVGQHLRHLNFSYRFAGDSCSLCHLGGEHADGTVDVVIDKSIAGAAAAWVPEAAGPGTPGTCIGTNEIRCHGNNAVDPEWKVRTPEPNGPKLVECNECHGFTGLTFDIAGNSSQIPHVSDGGQVRDCTWCHVEGHPREGYSISALTKANPAQITSDNHHLHTGDTVLLHVEGMYELDRWYGTVTVIDDHNFTLDGVDSSSYGTFSVGYWKRTYAAKTISAISKANPARVTSAGHGLATGDNVLLNLSGMTQLHDYDGPVTVIDADNFTLDGVNSSSYGTFTAGDWIKVDGTILVPNYSIGGIDYSSGGIHLKRVVNNRTHLNNGEMINTEAETCWGCHEDNGISEWGTDTVPLNSGMDHGYDYGSLNQSSWIGAIWSSAAFSYKDGAIQSTHSVNPSVSGPGLDSAKQLRCSYCHDVHDLNKAPNDATSGAPYLRGSWQSNPYPEDGAPGRNDRGAQIFTNANYYAWNIEFGNVPRGSSNSKMGGFWIDQNSNYPTASWNLQGSAGICTLCHGTDVDNMNKFADAGNAWIGTNGHSNSALGGSGVNAANIFRDSLRKADGSWAKPRLGYQNTDPIAGETDRYFGLRNYDGDSFMSAPSTTTHMSSTTQQMRGVYPYAMGWEDTQGTEIGMRYAYGDFVWGMGFSETAPDEMYHRFSCSKCHNPHASRLPRLMITNCLDVSHNTWDDLFANDRDWTNGGADSVARNWSTTAVMPYTGTDPRGKAYNKQFAYATSAQNCHRYVDINGDGNPDEAGWNKLTPWRE